MEDGLVKYISQYISLTPEEEELIRQSGLIKSVPKGTVLLREGEVAKECYLVLSGCVRSYYLIDGEEKTTEFFTENQPVTSVSYLNSSPSEYYIATVEDCILSSGNQEKTEQSLKDFPKMGLLINIISSELIANKQVSADDLKNLSPENRYLKLMETRPELLNRVPQYQLASYLGIKAESLSRIRKRIRDNG